MLSIRVAKGKAFAERLCMKLPMKPSKLKWDGQFREKEKAAQIFKEETPVTK